MPAAEQPIPSVWTSPRRQRREQPALTRELIVSQAVRLLDAEGVDALSMRRLGAELDAPATSINWHVAKEELIELVVHEVFGEVTVPQAADPAGWRVAVTDFAHALRSMILRHPWIGSMLGDVLIDLGPNMMRLSEAILAVFETAGFSPEQADHALNTLVAYVIGTAAGEAAVLMKLSHSGLDERDLANVQLPSTEQAGEMYPRLQERYAAYRGRDPRKARDETFSEGLKLILDGLELRLNGSTG